MGGGWRGVGATGQYYCVIPFPHGAVMFSPCLGKPHLISRLVREISFDLPAADNGL